MSSLRQRHLQALRRRAALQPAPVRQLLERRLQALQAAEDAATAQAPLTPAISAQIHVSPLAALLAELAPADAPTPATPAAPQDLKAVRDYRSTWSRLAVEQRVHQALARVPDNAGPLNTQRLVHQTLQALNQASPAYLHRLVTQVEALLWLEQLGAGAPAPAAPAPGPRLTRAGRPAARR